MHGLAGVGPGRVPYLGFEVGMASGKMTADDLLVGFGTRLAGGRGTIGARTLGIAGTKADGRYLTDGRSLGFGSSVVGEKRVTRDGRSLVIACNLVAGEVCERHAATPRTR